MLRFDDIKPLLSRVNREVNRLPYKADLTHYGVLEFWDRIDARGGDCEDYALEKRHRLIEAGMSAEDLRLAVVEAPDGTGHAVLTIDTDRGTMVLDNNSPSIREWTSTPYRWVMRQRGREWVAVTDPA